MNVFWIYYELKDEKDRFLTLSSWWELLWWFLRWSWRCSRFCIQLNPEPAGFLAEEKESPCETCLRWEECNGVDQDNCPKY